jgi:hypothetical protein
MPVPEFPSDAVVAWFFVVLLALWLSCLCAHSLLPNWVGVVIKTHHRKYAVWKKADAELRAGKHSSLQLNSKTEPLAS